MRRDYKQSAVSRTSRIEKNKKLLCLPIVTNANPYGGNLLRRVDIFSMLSLFLFLRKEQSHYDSSKYNCWLHGPASMDEKGNSCMFSPLTNKKTIGPGYPDRCSHH
jgi:hypothetical protein